MRAARIELSGRRKSLKIVHLERPAPRRDEVLIQVHATAVNSDDLVIGQGRGAPAVLPRIPGRDLAGEVVAVGCASHRNLLHRRILVDPFLSCGGCVHCARGHSALCSELGLIGSDIDGGYAEYVRIPARNAVPIPDNVSFTSAACLPSLYSCAAASLRRGRLVPGEWLLVMDAHKDLGMAVVELAHVLGAKVIAVSGHDAMAGALRDCGALIVLEPGHDLVARVLDATQGRGVDFAVDSPCESRAGSVVAALGRHGRLLVTGIFDGTRGEVDWGGIFSRQLQIIGSCGSHRQDLELVLHLQARGEIAPLVQDLLPLAQAAKAHAMLRQGVGCGRLLLLPGT